MHDNVVTSERTLVNPWSDAESKPEDPHMKMHVPSDIAYSYGEL
jgi:hypothetical protein